MWRGIEWGDGQAVGARAVETVDGLSIPGSLAEVGVELSSP